MGTQSMLATISELEHYADRAELVNGMIVAMTPNSFVHARVTLNVGSQIRDFLRARKLAGAVLVGDPGFIWDERNVRAPDVAYLDGEQVRLAPATGFMPFSPALAVEVVSHNDRWTEVRAKVRGWLAHGTRLVWIIDPQDRTVEVAAPQASPLELGPDDILDGGAVLPGLTVRVSELFA